MNELRKALKENSTNTISKGYGEGTGERGLFVLNRQTRKLERVERQKKPEVNAPFVITDEIDPTMSMTGTDKVHTSKATLRREYRELGFIETGGEKEKPPTRDIEKEREQRREHVAKALNDLRWGNVPIDERSREHNLREEREWQEYKRRQER